MMPDAEQTPYPRSTGWMLIAWPAFLAACLLEVLVFSMVDPGELHWPENFSQPSHRAVYSLAFFAFWAISTVSSGLVFWLAQTETVGEGLSDRPAD